MLKFIKKNFLDKFSKKSFESSFNNYGMSTFDKFISLFSHSGDSYYINKYKGWVHACIDASSNEIGNINLNLYKRKNNGDIELITSHEILDLLRRVNSSTTKFQLFKATQAFLELCGNSYWWVKGKKEIYQLHPSTTKFTLDSDNITNESIPKINYYITSVNINGNIKKLKIPADEVIMFKGFNPKAETLIPSKGVGTVEAALLSIEQDEQTNIWNLKFFKNSARPDLALESNSVMSRDQKDKLRKSWNEEFKGTNRSHRVAILDGLKLNKINFSQKEMDFINLKKVSKNEILGIFKTPPPIIGDLESSSGRSNVRESKQIYNDSKINPDKQRIVDYLNEFLIPMFTSDDLFFDFDKVQVYTREEQLSKYDNGSKNGWLSVNEIRREEGLKEVDGGDRLVVPNIEEPLDVKAYEIKKYIPTKKSFDKKTNDKILKLASVEIKKELMTEDKLEARYKQFETFSDDQIEKFRKMTYKQFNEQEKRILSNFKKSVSKKSAGEDMAKSIFNIEKESDIFAKNSLKTYFSIVEDAGNEAVELARSNYNFIITPIIRKEIEERAKKFFGDSVNNTTFDSLVRTLNLGIQNDESIDDLATRIKDVFMSAKTSRTITISRTESLNAINATQLEVYNQDEDVLELQWVATLDNRVRDQHRKLNGVTIKKGKKFSLGGMKIERPQDPALPASESIKCRCSLMPLVSTKIS